MYAVIVTGGKQYRVEKGDVIFVEKLNAEAESEFSPDIPPQEGQHAQDGPPSAVYKNRNHRDRRLTGEGI